MDYSVIIPAYNAQKTIRQTIDSVLAQTHPPLEILVCDDGSTDATGEILRSYGDQIQPFFRSNHGVDATRNFLCKQARGAMLAFLDADDLWHPRYLEFQEQLRTTFAGAVGYFTQHINIIGLNGYTFKEPFTDLAPVTISPKEFLHEYNRRPLSFQMSGFCMPTALLSKLPTEPFYLRRGSDTYLHTMLPLFGPVVHTEVALVAYRIIDTSLSADQVASSMWTINAMTELVPHYLRLGTAELKAAFWAVSASRRRAYGRHLMGVKRVSEARGHFWSAAKDCWRPVSFAKSLVLLVFTFLPSQLQPCWPPPTRRLTESQTALH